MSLAEPTRIVVGGEARYDVVVGANVLGELPALLEGSLVVAVVHQQALLARAVAVADALRAAGQEPHLVPVPDGEPAKSFAVAEYLWEQFGALAVSRSDAVVAVGGGAVTDVTGFAAATWLRGVRVVHLPTTLLGMVDAAIGGKTGVNTAAGKNLVGAFHSPAGVLVDLESLTTLPRDEYVSGLAEVIKVGFIADPAILELVEEDPAAAVDPAGPHTRELVERAIGVKARVVAGDFRESGPREALNYGHTLGHAIERVESFQRRHGEAISIGMTFAAELARLAGRLDPATVSRHRAVLTAIGLPTGYSGASWESLRAAMQGDKKSRSGTLRFVVLDGLARPGILSDPPPDLLAAAFSEVAT